MKIHIVFHSMYGHVWKLAEAIAEGARGVEGAEVKVFRVPETMSADALAKAGATEAQQAFAHLPVATNDDLEGADALIFGAGTRYGSMAGQMRTFLDQTGGLWARGALEGKVGSAFASTATQHGGQELTLMAFHANMFHFGMVLVGLPYSAKEQMTITEITGGAPYGVTTIAGGQGERQPSENELTLARFQGKHVAELAKKLAK